MIGHANILGDVIKSPLFVVCWLHHISMFASLIPIFGDVQTGVCCFPLPFRGGILGQTLNSF
jgi:hypothetical protein